MTPHQVPVRDAFGRAGVLTVQASTDGGYCALLTPRGEGVLIDPVDIEQLMTGLRDLRTELLQGTRWSR